MLEVPIHQPCFGRAADLEKLQSRVRQRGVTFVMAPPRMGKTWLVRNLAFRWARHEGWNIGYAESSGGQNDLLREVVSDLYKRWLGGAGFIAQAKSLWERHKDGLVGKVGGEVGKLLGKLAKLGDGDLAGAEKLIDGTFDALTRAEQDLRRGGLILKPITYEDARDLVRTVATVTDKPILLVMDAWERGLDLASDRGSIQKLLTNDQDWPVEFHLVVVIRDLPKHLDEVRFADECCDSYPSAARTVVDMLDLSNLDEQERLLLYLRDKIPAVAEADGQWVVEQCRSPAVIEWWIRRQPADQESLIAEAANARNSQYMGLFDLIEQVKEREPLFDATVRLALLPEITSARMWQPYRELIGSDNPDALIADLQGRRILDPNQSDYPSFGHPTAYDSVSAFLLRPPSNRSQGDLRPRVRELLKELVSDLAGRIHSVSQENLPFAVALPNTIHAVRAAGLNYVWLWPTRLALSLFGARLSAPEREDLLAAISSIDAEVPAARGLLAMGLVNTLHHAKDEEDLPHRDALLTKLRELSQAHPEDAAIRTKLAIALFATLSHATAEQNLPRRDVVLTELRELSQAYPEDAAVRAELAKALSNTLRDAKHEQDLPRRDALLVELRELSKAYFDDDPVRRNLAMGLFNDLSHAKDEQDLARRNARLAELRELSQSHPDAAAVRENLAMGLFNALNHAKDEQDLPRRDGLLNELRELGEAHPEDAAVRSALAAGLFNSLQHAKDEQDLAQRDVLLAALLELSQAHPEDTALREQLAKGMFSTLTYPDGDRDRPHRDARLTDLRELSQAHPEDRAVRKNLAAGLFNTLNQAKEEQDLPRRDTLLTELRKLNQTHPEDAAVRESLAKGLCNTLHQVKDEQDLPRRNALLTELRELSQSHPEDADVRAVLAAGLFNTLGHAMDEQDPDRCDTLLTELRGLLDRHADDERLATMRAMVDELTRLG